MPDDARVGRVCNLETSLTTRNPHPGPRASSILGSFKKLPKLYFQYNRLTGRPTADKSAGSPLVVCRTSRLALRLQAAEAFTAAHPAGPRVFRV